MQTPIMPNTGAPITINIHGGAPQCHHIVAPPPHHHDDLDIFLAPPPPPPCQVAAPATDSLIQQLLAMIMSLFGGANQGGYGQGYGQNYGYCYEPPGTAAGFAASRVPSEPTEPEKSGGSSKPNRHLNYEEVRGGLHKTFGGPNGLVNYIKEKTGTTNEYLKPEDVRLAADMEEDPEKKAYLEFFYGHFGDIDKKKGQIKHANGTDGKIGAGDIQEYFGWTGGHSQTR